MGSEKDDANDCGRKSVEGDAYRKGCVAAKDLGGNVLNNTIPDAHEVFTSCKSCDEVFHDFSCSKSYWNPKRFNYYVHYDYNLFCFYTISFCCSILRLRE